MKRLLAMIAALAVFAAVLTGVPARAQQAAGGDPVEQAFRDADDNGDGVVNIDEFVAYTVYLFRGYDKNGDRFLVIAEIPNANPVRFKTADRDGDGRLSLGEAVAARVIDFFEMDTDRNGVITITEVRAYEQKLGGTRR